MKKRIYVAAPLFNEMELERNSKIKTILVNNGYEVYLPQDEAGLKELIVPIYYFFF